MLLTCGHETPQEMEWNSQVIRTIFFNRNVYVMSHCPVLLYCTDRRHQVCTVMTLALSCRRFPHRVLGSAPPTLADFRRTFCSTHAGHACSSIYSIRHSPKWINMGVGRELRNPTSNSQQCKSNLLGNILTRFLGIGQKCFWKMKESRLWYHRELNKSADRFVRLGYWFSVLK